MTCEVQIRPDTLFLEGGPGGQVPAIVGIEYMAQTVAVFAGLSARADGQPPRIGFLIGCRELKIDADGFAVGDRLRVEARRVWGERDVGSFACKVAREGEVLLQGTLTVYQGPIPQEDRR